MNPDTNNNYLTNSLAGAKAFARDMAASLRKILFASKYGYGSKQSAVESVKNVASAPAEAAAAAVGDVLTDSTRRQVWKATSVPRMAGSVATTVARKVGMDPVSGAVLTAAAPLALLSLSGTAGPLTQGLRPSGYKAVAPKSKEEDPTGREPQSLPLEIALRYGLGQRSQMLPYAEFVKERPDVLPSVYSEYRRYSQAKPQPGELFSVDPTGRSFTTVGGIVRGSATGLNDPELRIKGMPITASGLLGTVAGLGTAVAAYHLLPKHMKQERMMQGTDYSPAAAAHRAEIQQRLDPLVKKEGQLQSIIERVQSQMRAKNIEPFQRWSSDPGDLTAMRLREALQRRNEYHDLLGQIKEHEYALGRATGEIPGPEDVELHFTQTQPRERHAALHRGRVAAGLSKDISFSPDAENIEYLEETISNLKAKASGIKEENLQTLRALELPEEALTLQARLMRAKSKKADISTKSAETAKELRATYRPININTPSLKTVAGLTLAGTAAALGTAYVVKKLFEKSNEKRIKEENPVEYLKYKHGSLEQARDTLGVPGARSWNELVPHMS